MARHRCADQLTRIGIPQVQIVIGVGRDYAMSIWADRYGGDNSRLLPDARRADRLTGAQVPEPYGANLAADHGAFRIRSESNAGCGDIGPRDGSAESITGIDIPDLQPTVLAAGNHVFAVRALAEWCPGRSSDDTR